MLWRLKWGKFPSFDRLIKHRAIIQNNKCLLCRVSEESTEHVFFKMLIPAWAANGNLVHAWRYRELQSSTNFILLAEKLDLITPNSKCQGLHWSFKTALAWQLCREMNVRYKKGKSRTETLIIKETLLMTETGFRPNKHKRKQKTADEENALSYWDSTMIALCDDGSHMQVN